MGVESLFGALDEKRIRRPAGYGAGRRRERGFQRGKLKEGDRAGGRGGWDGGAVSRTGGEPVGCASGERGPRRRGGGVCDDPVCGERTGRRPVAGEATTAGDAGGGAARMRWRCGLWAWSMLKRWYVERNGGGAWILSLWAAGVTWANSASRASGEAAKDSLQCRIVRGQGTRHLVEGTLDPLVGRNCCFPKVPSRQLLG